MTRHVNPHFGFFIGTKESIVSIWNFYVLLKNLVKHDQNILLIDQYNYGLSCMIFVSFIYSEGARGTAMKPLAAELRCYRMFIG